MLFYFKIAIQHSTAVTACNVDLETLIGDSNRTIATLAITTLKIDNEADVDRLMKQVSSVLSEISDLFKIVVVDTIKSLYEKFPSKHSVLITFLSNMLREGGYICKRAIVNTIISIIEENSEAKEASFTHLCEFIEDCERTTLSTRKLYSSDREGPRITTPAKYIRYIYHRIILENLPVRAADINVGGSPSRRESDLVSHRENTHNEKVTVQMDGSTEGVEVVHYTPYSLKKCNDMDTTYTLVKLPDDSSAVTGTLSCAMKYTVKDCDPATGEPDNEKG
ncbi:unnamed protein product [Rotaria sp. Silwood2]|nr:unnamed protein product [Rotaria sp. Silwood2]